MITQLNPSIPVQVVGKGTGECLFLLDYGKEDHLIWVVAMDDTGEVWAVPNPEIRLIKNYTIGRNLKSSEKITGGYLSVDREEAFKKNLDLTKELSKQIDDIVYGKL